MPDSIWEVAEGGLTDGEPMIFVFGNPTRNTGKFKQCFSSSRWQTKQIDSRTAKMTNKKLIAEWAEDWGEDSDFFRVRVLGKFPRAGSTQFMDTDLVVDAMNADVGRYLPDEPLICGFDVARGGDDNCMIVFRRGNDAKSIKSYKIIGEDSRDSMKVVSKLCMVLDRHQPDVVFIDVTGIGGPVLDRLNQLNYNCFGVGFGHDADDKRRFKNKTAEMGWRMKEWLMAGGTLPNNNQLENELTAREFWHDDKEKFVLEPKKLMKKRIHCSPDHADAFYLTFAMKAAALQTSRADKDRHQHNDIEDHNSGFGGHDPFDGL